MEVEVLVKVLLKVDVLVCDVEEVEVVRLSVAND